MEKQKIDFSIMFSPWSIDTYNLFNFDSEIEMILLDQNEDNKPSDYDDYEWTFETKEYVQALAENWQHLLNKYILDEVILSVELEGEAYSPREYNFSTDNCAVIFTVDVDKLNEYIDRNKEDFEQNKI